MCLQIRTHAHVGGGEEEEEDAGEDAWKERCSGGGYYLKGTVLSVEGERVISLLSSAVMSSSSSWDSFWRRWIPDPTGSCSLGEQKGSVKEEWVQKVASLLDLHSGWSCSVAPTPRVPELSGKGPFQKTGCSSGSGCELGGATALCLSSHSWLWGGGR